jgi:hypothetical protein
MFYLTERELTCVMIVFQTDFVSFVVHISDRSCPGIQCVPCCTIVKPQRVYEIYSGQSSFFYEKYFLMHLNGGIHFDVVCVFSFSAVQ